MSVLGKLLKGAAVGTVVGGYNIAKGANNILKEKIELAKLDELLERQTEYEKQIAHFSDEERQAIAKMSKAFSMRKLAESKASDMNELSRLKFKYGLITATPKVQIETK